MTPPRGPKRSKANELYPPRFHVKKDGRVFHVTSTKPQKWTRIGRDDDMAAAIAAWGRIEYSQAPMTDGTVRAVAAKFIAILDDPANPLEYASTTRRNYKLMLRLEPPATLILAFGKMLMTDIQSHHVADFLDASPHKSAANHQIRLLSRMFRYCIRKGLLGIKTNPCLIELNNEPSRDIYVDDALYCKIWHYASSSEEWKRCAAAMDISLITGWREGEVLKLREGDWDDQELRGSETKDVRKRMRVPMLPALEAAIQIALSARREPKKNRPYSLGAVEPIRRYLFEAKQRRPLTESGFRSCWGRMMRAAVADETITKEERFHFHDIRAKHASDREDDLAQLALGHTTPGMTKVYVRNPKGRKYPGLNSPAAGGGKKEEGMK